MLSYTKGPSLQLLNQTVGQVVSSAAATNPGGMALVSRHQQLRLTYHELERQVNLTARGLWGLGLRPGDRVGMWAASCAEWVYLQAATAMIGAVLVNVNPAYRVHELRLVLKQSRMKAIFLNESDARINYRDLLQEACNGPEMPLEHTVLLGTAEWNRMIEGGTEPAWPSPGIDDVINIQYTSGTTGAPKGVLLSHRNLVNNAFLTGRALRVSQHDKLISPVPMYHCFGCVLASLTCLIYRMTLVLPAAQFDARATLSAVEQERGTVIYGVPTMFIAQLEHPEFCKFDLSSLRTGIMAGAPCPVDVMRRVIGDMHCHQMTIGYGQTETSPLITQSSVDDDLETRVSTVGRAEPETEVRIVAPDTNETVPVGEIGELCSRGYLIMKGYDGDPEATSKTIDGQGWLHTGDLVVMRPDGRFHISGRLKEMVIRGGENIYPREIEEFLRQHPKISDACVLGLPDVRLGETVLAWIRLKANETASEDEIRTFCRGQIAHFKVPHYIRFVESFPMTVTGKIQKFKIREQEILARGLEKAAAIQTA